MPPPPPHRFPGPLARVSSTRPSGRSSERWSAAGGTARLSSCFFSSNRALGIPVCSFDASSKASHISLHTSAAALSPRNPDRSICAFFGSTLTFGASGSISGKNKFTAVLCTISSSNPSDWVILDSIQSARTVRLTLETSKDSRKLAGNLVFFRALLRARLSTTDEVPLMDGIVSQVVTAPDYDGRSDGGAVVSQ